jgi:hypothetical protein
MEQRRAGTEVQRVDYQPMRVRSEVICAVWCLPCHA